MDLSAPSYPSHVMDDLFPRPLMRRKVWTSLNGEWEFSDNRDKLATNPAEVRWNGKIEVPFSPETSASGVGDTGFYESVWYRRTWNATPLQAGQRLLLHFEAVDWRAIVWVNGRRVCQHEGGYTPFSADITDALVPGEVQEVIVCADDDPADLAKPRGKQDWKLESHSIWYPRTTGIWQSVWLETVPSTRIKSLHWSSNLERWEVGLEAEIHCDDSPSADSGNASQHLQLAVRLTTDEQVLADDSYAVIADEVHRRVALSDPGIDDSRNALLWSPASPVIIDAVLELKTHDGVVLDTVHSYTALRNVSAKGDRFLLNGKPLQLRLVLDQGYWPQSGLTAPDDTAFARDILLAKSLGFNGVRKHQKIESARFLYWADHLGLLVWEEMPSAYRYTPQSIQRVTREWLEVLDRDRSHPCIVTWVPFNESWGVPDLPLVPDQRHYVRALYELTKALDPTRPVIGNDGWEIVATDIVGIHDYDNVPERLGVRYGMQHVESGLFERERPGGRVLRFERHHKGALPIVLTEFGGIALSRPASPSAAETAPPIKTAEDVMSPGSSERDAATPAAWGYSVSAHAADFLKQYSLLLETVRSLPALAGFCYTQFTDTYQEINGLLYADRTPKASPAAIALATSGLQPESDIQTELLWRQGAMQP